MTPAEIRDAIAASSTLQAAATAKNWASIAETLASGRKVVVPNIVTARGIAAAYPSGPLASEALLLKLEAARDSMLASTDANTKLLGSLLRRQLAFLSSVGLDFGDAAMRSQLDSLASAGVITTGEAANLKALGEKPDAITALDVEAAVGLQPVTTWTGTVTATSIQNGMTYASITYTSSDTTVAPRVEQTWANDLTPGRVAAIIALRCAAFQTTDASHRLFG